MKKNIILVFILIFSISLNAQEVNLDALIYKAEKSVNNYSEVFKNLSATEILYEYQSSKFGVLVPKLFRFY